VLPENGGGGNAAFVGTRERIERVMPVKFERLGVPGASFQGWAQGKAAKDSKMGCSVRRAFGIELDGHERHILIHGDSIYWR